MRKSISFILIAGIALLLPAVALAQTPAATPETKNNTADCPKGYQCLESPLQGKLEVSSLIGTVIKIALSLIGSITLFMLIWGGFQWLTSAGNDEKVHAGTQTMLWAVIGLGVVFGSYLFLTTYVNFLTGGN